MTQLPPIVNKLCHLHEGWIVGSAADTNVEKPSDWDVVISFAHWREAVALIPSSAKPNSFGGWKFIDAGVVIDVWPCDLFWLLTNSATINIWHPRTNRRLKVL